MACWPWTRRTRWVQCAVCDNSEGGQWPQQRDKLQQAKNLKTTRKKGGKGQAGVGDHMQASMSALTIFQLQQTLRNARVVYSSATIATKYVCPPMPMFSVPSLPPTTHPTHPLHMRALFPNTAPTTSNASCASGSGGRAPPSRTPPPSPTPCTTPAFPGWSSWRSTSRARASSSPAAWDSRWVNLCGSSAVVFPKYPWPEGVRANGFHRIVVHV